MLSNTTCARSSRRPAWRSLRAWARRWCSSASCGWASAATDRALLFKYLADILGLRCRVARGEYQYGRGTDDVDGHAWNVVIVGKAQ
jgi:hypothetical protein